MKLTNLSLECVGDMRRGYDPDLDDADVGPNRLDIPDLRRRSGPVRSGVPNAQILLTQTDTGQVHKIASSASGSYIIPDLPAGNYTFRSPPRDSAPTCRRTLFWTSGPTPRSMSS